MHYLTPNSINDIFSPFTPTPVDYTVKSAIITPKHNLQLIEFFLTIMSNSIKIPKRLNVPATKENTCAMIDNDE